MKKGKKKMGEVTSCLFKILGAGAFLYLALICLYCGFVPAFSWFWAGLGIGGILCGTLLQHFEGKDHRGYLAVCGLLLTAFVIGVLTLLFSIGILSKAGNRKPQKGADYLIVLGAKVKGKEPSVALSGRIQTAYDYLEQNPGTKAVLTGGKGRGEDISESSCMETALLKKNIAKSRLYKEEKSTTTIENIAYAKEYIEDKNANIVVVTSDFHVKRGVAIAKEAGYVHVEGLGDTSVPIMRLHYYTRETLAWIKYSLTK